MDFDRVLAIVIDSIGVGGAPDAERYHSDGADTLGHVASWFPRELGRPLALPHLEELGIALTHPGGLEGVSSPEAPKAAHGRMQITSFGNDSLDGHWEMMCLPARFNVDYFPDGFPDELLDPIREFSGRGILCNKPYSGTDVIRNFGEEQLRTGDLIVYTSGDSVLQIAAHEEVIPLEELYRICEYARTLINGPAFTVGRVIARPYVGTNAGDFTRTANRRDYGLEPYGSTAIDFLHDAGYNTIAVGKTFDLFRGNGFSESFHNESNHNGMEHVIAVMGRRDWRGLCFTNLVDFDAVYGHRRDPKGDGLALEDFDAQLGEVMRLMGERDLLLITADHGNDPTYRGTDHTRELVPLLAWSPAMTTPGRGLGLRTTASDLGATVLDNFKVAGNGEGRSFLTDLR
ncbi:phosphopentomutase [Collinsella vaginalis]|uniref:phosphopentomutase n=1 Tax=Collinsella vaginalis TaxID=1870987 RepID=UPI000A269DA1|nr:phosphopentomutase [Collinsella vaginalis]